MAVRALLISSVKRGSIPIYRLVMPAKLHITPSRVKLSIFLVLGLLVVLVLGQLFSWISSRRPPLTFNTPIANAFAKMYTSDGVVGRMTDKFDVESSQFELAPPDKLKIVYNFGSQKTVAIRTESEIYTQLSNDKWQKIPLPSSPDTGVGYTLPVPFQAELSQLSKSEKDKSQFNREAAAKCPKSEKNCVVYKQLLGKDQHLLYFIEKSSKRLVVVEHYLNNNLATITQFSYQKVDLALPTNFVTVAPSQASGSAAPTPSLSEDVRRQIEAENQKLSVTPSPSPRR